MNETIAADACMALRRPPDGRSRGGCGPRGSASGSCRSWPWRSSSSASGTSCATTGTGSPGRPRRRGGGPARLGRDRILLPDGPGRRLRLAGQVRDLQHGPRPPKRGEPVPLPDGVVARMQLSPYRLQLAGIRTAPVAYRPLARGGRGVGVVEPDERRIESDRSDGGGDRPGRPRKPGAFLRRGDLVATLDLRRGDRPGRERDPRAGPRSGRHRATGLALVVGVRVRRGDELEAGSGRLRGGGLDTVCMEAEVFESDRGFLAEGQAAEVQ